MALLGLDIGTSATKALVLTPQGKVVATAESAHVLKTPRPGWSEQDPEGWWRAVVLATGSVLKKAGIHGSEITAIGLSGQMHGSVFLGDGPRPLRPALLWNDQRTAKECREIETLAGGRESLINMVGNPALTGFTAPKILWLRANEPSRYEKCRHVLLPKDYIRYRLTGEYAGEVSDASGTLLFDVKNRRWSKELIDRLGIDSNWLPRISESQEISGAVSAAAAEFMPLRKGTPVVGGAGDQAAGAVGTGVVSAGLLSASMGTSGVIFAASSVPQTDPRGRVHTMCHAVPETWCVFGCMLSAGGSLQWLRNMLLSREVEQLVRRKKDPGVLYERLIEQAQQSPAGIEHLFFLPYLTGERCPHPDPYASGAFIGLTPRHQQSHLIRSVLEGITFGMREQVAIMRSMGLKVDQVRASGGGARSSFWRQMQADMYEAPVVTVNVSEGAALGAAILAGVGTGVWKTVSQATTAIIKIQHRSLPHKIRAAQYAKLYRTYAALYPALQNVFPMLAGDAC